MAWILAASFVLPTAGYADKIHQEDGIMNNHSTEYVRTLNRNASTEPDAAFYNPAGLVFLAANGLYINFSSQTYHVKRAHTMDFYAIKRDTGPVEKTPHSLEYFIGTLPDEYTAELTAPVLPGFDLVWKQDRWAVYFDLAVMQAATDMTFDRGIAILDWGNLIIFETNFDTDNNHFISYSTNSKAIRNEMYLGFTLGGAYKILNWFSAGGGLRVISAKGNMKVQSNQIRYYYTDNTTGDFYLEKGSEWDIDTDTKGMGYGVILSMHFNPGETIHALKGLHAAIRCEYYLPMELEKKTNKFAAPSPTILSGNLDIFMDGSDNPAFEGRKGSKTLKATYPPTINLGISYLLLGWINLLSSGQLTLRRMNDLDGREKDFNIGYQIGAGAEFILTDKITLSMGYLYNDFGIKPEARTEADQMLRSHTMGAGGKFAVDDNLIINIGAFYQYFVPATNYEVQYTNVTGPTWSYLKKEFKESRYSVSIGITYRMFGDSSDKFAEKNNLMLPHKDAKHQ